MEQTSYGATYQRLIEIGYAPCSALAPDGRVLGGMGPPVPHRPHQLAEHPAALLCRPADPSRAVAALVLATPDQKLRGSINAILKAHDLHRGPVRIASDGTEWHLLQVQDGEWALARETRTLEGEVSPVALLEYTFRPVDWHSEIVPLAGRWVGGDPLTVARAKLPAIDREKVKTLFAALDAAVGASFPPVTPRLYSHEEIAVRQQLADAHRPRFAAPRSKRDFLGNEALREAWPDLYESLPDKPPADAPPRSAPRAGTFATQEELDAIAALDFQR
jgi:hypothetical protein